MVAERNGDFRVMTAAHLFGATSRIRLVFATYYYPTGYGPVFAVFKQE